MRIYSRRQGGRQPRIYVRSGRRMIGDFRDGLSRVRAGRFFWLDRTVLLRRDELAVDPSRTSDFKRSVCTCASYTRPQLVHLSVRYSKPARIWTTLWTVGRARHLGQRGRPSGAVDATGPDRGTSMSPIGSSSTGADNPFEPVSVPWARTEDSLI